ncbi:spermatogenesis-associated protein 1 [Seriola lalandi dorsalis]|uniref:spermatogenesis-associated protein 1 n=1 Tax=Seriola lalandi dorsalis TaxID=1841481 RepID=UPI000C6F6584|nr:spermatogenesis-associated protein 1 [Seriola lalandi dorsalis]
MELSCESVRYPKDRRPASCKFVELHVLYVPDDQWNVKLNKVPAEAIESFISAGFIRVYPDTTLKTLRSELGTLLGADRNINKFSFLKCVGRSLALVKIKQERYLKVKTFAPPYAPQPELYLLSTAESDSSVCSQSLSPDTSSSSPDHPTYYHPPKTCSLPTVTKEPGDGENEEEALSSNKPEWAEQERCPRKIQNHKAPEPVSLNKVLHQREADSAQVKELPEKEKTCRKKKQYHRENKAARDSGVAESLEDRDSGFSVTGRYCEQRHHSVLYSYPAVSTSATTACSSNSVSLCRLGKPKDAHRLKSVRSKPTSGVTESPAVLSWPVRCTSPPQGLNLALVTHKTAASPVFQTTREELIEEIKLVREERKQLEWTRQELLRKGKDLLALNRHRRNQARDSWKKKYFETKKATAPLEDNLRNLRQEMETFYNKLLHQLQARDNRGKPRRQGRFSVKNELIIQIMTEIHEIDNLKRKVEHAKMKLVTEIKLRKQAATELRALKAELAQKKSQSSHPVPMASLGFGNTTRDRPQVQNTSI